MFPSAIQTNRLLASIPGEELACIRSFLQPVTLRTTDEINFVKSPVWHLCFPIDAVISHMEMTPSGQTVEVAVTGKEGCSGFSVVDGLNVSPARTIVQIGGQAYRLAVKDLNALESQIPTLIRAIRRYGAVVLRHVIVSVGCNRFHSVEQRTARWLLAHRHRTGRAQFPFTHDFLAEQLGAKRATVTELLGEWQRRGYVKYAYGQIYLLDSILIGKKTCNCLKTATQAIDDYLQDIAAYARKDIAA